MTMTLTPRLITNLALTVLLHNSVMAASYTPMTNQAVSWEGFAWQFGVWGNMLLDRVVDDGYTQTFYFDSNYPAGNMDDDAETCTRLAWEDISRHMGVFYGGGHGTVYKLKGWFSVVAFKNLDPANRYISSGNGRDGWDVWYNPKRKTFSCVVNSSWLRTHWKPFCDLNRSIMFWSACRTAVGANSVMRSAGGRVAYGYTGLDAYQDRKNLPAIFDRMNGRQPRTAKGSMRVAEVAFGGLADGYSQGGNWVTPDLRLLGNGRTTLCPAVEYLVGPNVWPRGNKVHASDVGFVMLDTFCVRFSSPIKSVMAHTATFKQIYFKDQMDRLFIMFDVNVKQGEDLRRVDVNNVRWNNDGTEIWFDYKGDCASAGFSITVDLKPGLVQALNTGSQGVPGLYLDGGDLQESGVAPNNHRFTWTFSRGF